MSEAVAETATVLLTVAPLAGALKATVGGVVSPGAVLLTVTVREAAVAVLPAASRATAVSAWLPFVVVVVVQVIEYGLVVSSAPRFAPSRRNCTPVTPTLSDAVAETATAPLTVAPLAGALRATVGGVVSPLPPPVRTCIGRRTRNASRRFPPMLVIQK